MLQNQSVSQVIRVALASSTPGETERLAQQLGASAQMSFRVLGRASERSDFEKLLERHACELDLLITDVVLEGADVTQAIARAKRQNPRLDILVCTSQSQDAMVIRAILAGAMGYLLKGDQEDLLTSIRLLRGGGSPVSPMVARSVLRAIHSRTVVSNEPARRRDMGDLPQLSGREKEILTLLAKGISFADIGTILSISPHTVTAHIKKIYRKLQVHSRGEAVYEATCLGILSDRGA